VMRGLVHLSIKSQTLLYSAFGSALTGRQARGLTTAQTKTEMISLTHFGWNETFQPQQINSNDNLSIGRVISIQGFKYFLITANGEMEAELSGKLMYGAASEQLPKVGDWVKLMEYDQLGYIIEVLPRINELSRKTPGKQTERQVLATNVDFGLIVQGLDRDFNLMRLERYLVQLAACKVTPIVILNKADLVTDFDYYRNEISKLQRNCREHFCSTYTGLGMEELNNSILEKFKTYILIGSSGVGKSSLLNALTTSNEQVVNTTSSFNNKGKHTTTTRDLFQLPNGSLLIDSPGMREFGLTFEEGQQADDLFPVIQKFASSCRYSDCTHTNETECGVIDAINSGELDAEVYESYLKLIREQRRFSIRIEDKKRINKQFGKLTKEAKSHRKKYKY
jgi:ribosome biogenesis GTPase